MSLWDRILGRAPRTASPPPPGHSLPPPPSPEERREWIRFLGQCHIFAELPARVRDAIVSRLHEKHFAAGATLMRQGEPGDCLMLIADGRVEVRMQLEGGSTHRLAVLGPRDIIGEMALLTREPRTADVTALDAIRVLVLPASAFDELADLHPEIPVVLTDLLADRLGQSTVDGLGEKLLDGYRVHRCLGRGGMAVVYAAEKDGKPVALKMMSHRLVFDSDALRRFQREADIAESFQYERIARVYGRFEAYRTYFLIMELCDGPTLQEVIRARGALDESFIRPVIGQLAAALAHVHSRSVVHRDVKPSNVLLTAKGSIKLTDFGLALPTLDSGLTRSGMIVGTPSYMAPEQLAGKEVTDRVDVYALGCTLLEMLRGTPAFDESDLTSLIYQKLTFRLPSPEEIRPGLSDDLYEVLRRSLAKTPEERDLDLFELSEWARPLDPTIWAHLREADGDAPLPLSSNLPTRTEVRPR